MEIYGEINMSETQKQRSVINVTIRHDLKTKFNFFIAWLKRYRAEEGVWTQNTAIDEVLLNSERWQEFLMSEED